MDINKYDQLRSQARQRFGGSFVEKARQAGYNDDEINSYIASVSDRLVAQGLQDDAARRQSSQQPKKQKGFWTDQISTGGGLAGALGGAAAGAAAGSVVPVIGTAAGGILGALLGGALGGGGGEVAENYIMGEEDKFKNVGKEALLNGVMGAGPIRAGSLAVRGVSGLARGSGKEALAQAGTKALTDKPIRALLSKPLVNVADKATIRGVGLTPTQITNFQSKTGLDPVDFMKQQGLAGAGAEEIGGKIGQLNGRFGEIVSTAGDVPKKDIMNVVNQTAKELAAKGPSQYTKTAKDLVAEMKTSLAKYGKTIPASELNTLKRSYDNLVNYTEKAANPDRYGVNKRAADVLRSSLQGASERSGAAGAGELRQVGQDLMALKQLEKGALRQANNGRGSGPIGLRDTIMTGAGAMAGGVPGAIATGAATHAVNSKVGQRLIAQGADAAASRLTAPVRGLTPGGVIGRVGMAGLVSGGLNAALGGTPDIQPTGDLDLDSQSLLDSALGDPTLTGASQDTGMAIPKEEIMAAMVEDLQTTGGKNIDKLKTIYELSQPEKEDPMSSQAAKDLSNSQAGIDAINNLRTLLSGDPSLQKKSIIDGQAFGGLAGALLGTGEYDAARQQAVDVIARLRTGAAITSTEEKRFLKMLPQAFDSPEVAGYKLGVLQKAFETVANRGGGSPSMDALATY